MRFASKITLGLLFALLAACVVRTSHLNKGIACFRVENYREAFIHLKPEAEKGQPDAQYAVGYMYYYGRGVVENRKQACLWINRAAKAGQPDALLALKIIKTQPKRAVRDPLEPLIYASPSHTRPNSP